MAANILNNFVLNGVLQMEAMLSNPQIIWKGESVTCIPSTLNTNVKTSDTGFNENVDFRFTIRLNQFATGIYPQLNDYLTYNGNNLLIIEIKQTPHNLFWVYVCKIPSINR